MKRWGEERREEYLRKLSRTHTHTHSQKKGSEQKLTINIMGLAPPPTFVRDMPSSSMCEKWPAHLENSKTRLVKKLNIICIFFSFLVFHTFFCTFHRVVVITLIIIKDLP